MRPSPERGSVRNDRNMRVATLVDLAPCDSRQAGTIRRAFSLLMAGAGNESGDLPTAGHSRGGASRGACLACEAVVSKAKDRANSPLRRALWREEAQVLT
jgi:hypothetical protein